MNDKLFKEYTTFFIIMTFDYKYSLTLLESTDREINILYNI